MVQVYVARAQAGEAHRDSRDHCMRKRHGRGSLGLGNGTSAYLQAR